MAINLFGVVFSKKPVTLRVRTHEAIHTAQMRELWYVGFYVWYVVEFVIRLLWWFSWRRAYRGVLFEREAYRHEDDPTYPVSGRKRFAFIKCQ